MLLRNEACVNILMEQRGDVWVGCYLASRIPLRRSTDQRVSNDMLEATLSPTPSIHSLIFRQMATVPTDSLELAVLEHFVFHTCVFLIQKQIDEQ